MGRSCFEQEKAIVIKMKILMVLKDVIDFMALLFCTIPCVGCLQSMKLRHTL